jgi:hypothetical protein
MTPEELKKEAEQKKAKVAAEKAYHLKEVDYFKSKAAYHQAKAEACDEFELAPQAPSGAFGGL